MAAQAVPTRVSRLARPETRASRVVMYALALVALLLMGSLVLPFASALLFAAVLAAAVHPGLLWLTHHFGKRRQLAAVVLTVGVVLLLVLPVSLLTVSLGAQVVEGATYVRETLRDRGLPGLIAAAPPSLKPLASWALGRLPDRGQEIEKLAQDHTGDAAAAVGGALRATTSIVFQVAIMAIAFFFFLLDGPALVRWLAEATPLPDAQVFQILTDFRNVSVAVLVSSIATAGVQSLAALGGYLAAGVPKPVFFTVVTFVGAFIPAIGAATVVVALGGLLYCTGHPLAGSLLALWGVLGVGFIDNLVKPWLMKGRMEIHGALIFFALLGGLATFGPVGLVAGPLILSFFFAVVRLWKTAPPLDEPLA